MAMIFKLSNLGDLLQSNLSNLECGCVVDQFGLGQEPTIKPKSLCPLKMTVIWKFQRRKLFESSLMETRLQIFESEKMGGKLKKWAREPSPAQPSPE